MKTNIIAVDQRFDFGTKKVRSYVVFLVEGKEIRAEVEDLEEVRLLINSGLGDEVLPSVAPTQVAVARPPVEVAEQPQFEEQPQEEDADPVVAWEEMGSGIISSGILKALKALQTPPQMRLSALQQLMGEILDGFTPDDWRSVGVGVEEIASLTPAPPPVAAPAGVRPPPAPVGQITWSDGSPMLPGASASRARHVQADEKGYPIVDGGRDPGEVIGAGDDHDEDGVGQM